MTSVSYEGATHRVRVDGPCHDAGPVCDALETFGTGTPTLTLDLTRLTEIDEETATAIVDAVTAVERRGCRITIVRKHDTDVDRVLHDLAR